MLRKKVEPGETGNEVYGAVAVGLGIVTAVDQNYGNCGAQIHATTKNVGHSKFDRIPLHVVDRNNGGDVREMENENYTYVTMHGPNKSHTRVYYKGCETVRVTVDQRSCLFDISSAVAPVYLVASDYLSSCHLCLKKLQGKDVYMYRGEQAFCSTQCRYKHIVMEEKKRKSCSSKASTSVAADYASVSACCIRSSNIDGHQIFNAGIFAV